jgi:hypothetical protein
MGRECASCEGILCPGPGTGLGTGPGTGLGLRRRQVCYARRMIRGLPLLIMLICTAAFSAESVEIITADAWARPRSAESLVQMPALKRTVRDYLRQGGGQEGRQGSGRNGSDNNRRGQRILIRHPRGEEGVLWAEELRSWLIALGIPSTDIAVSPESTRIDAIELAVTGADD